MTGNKDFRWRRRSSSGLFFLLACALLLTACMPPLGDRFPRPVGVGRSDDGQLRFVIPLCAGEAISSFAAADHRTEQPVWKVSRPTRPNMNTIVLGNAQEFAEQETPLASPLPSNLNVSATLTSDLVVESAFTLDQIPEDLAGTAQVVNMIGKGTAEPEKEFLRQADADYC
ncbi:hypothetical protein Skr01_22010 [Sphaerisporangium krabiense]|uniref:Uncharacterized protein n=1 Tax=Sphaerisporangium krabiense TaxID=763782 RepID=A0A7W9DRC7_9ACTN|nr:hypothetical protein [Sphaerisporangium krabiense]MBB5627954.1 hypothetical protein [Sphaerisporangium krabiense]GII62116.1 hypothetical protein Skr01_22010 [Sphaerisporangium krabiense]